MLVDDVGEAARSPAVGVADGVAGSAEQLSDSGSAVTVSLLPDGVPLPPEAKGLVVISESWDPPAMGPSGWAGQDPRGLRGDFILNGMVPGAPTANPPTNRFRLAPTY